MSASTPHPSARWISREFAELLADDARWSDGPQASARPFDVLIVGSGYGGAVAAAELAGCREGGRSLDVCVLERGREYLPGAFPSRMADLPGHVRGSVGERVRGGEALLDIRAGGDVSVVLANGLGGGSLINAGVMCRPEPAIFEDARWPASLRRWEAGQEPLAAHYLAAERLLGARVGAGPSEALNTIRRHQANVRLPKRAVLDAIGGAQDAALSVAMQDGQTTSGGVRLEACKLCGDCAMGCNYGAKESLDTNLLVKAFHAGARIYCGATVLRLQRPEPGPQAAPIEALWCVQVTHTEEKLRLREGGPRWITARKVILAAGALGSTEILLRSRREPAGPRFSELLGRRFSTNGDMAVIGYNYTGTAEAGAIANEDDPPEVRQVGPTITGMIRVQVHIGGQPKTLLIQEMSVAGPLRRMFEEGVATADVLQGLGEFDGSRHKDGHPVDDPFAVQPAKFRRTSAFAVMGDDGAAGTLRLGDAAGDWSGDGHITVDWPGANRLPLFDAQVAAVAALTERLRGKGRTLANPLWRPLTPSVEKLTGVRGPLLTVHPLGGCAMGEDVRTGVVDDCGQVFDPAAHGDPRFHAGLLVLDGSIVPMALGANPALTIAALALRAVRTLRKTWRWSEPAAATLAPRARPQVADIAAEIRARPPAETRVEFTERLSGKLVLAPGAPALWADVTLTYAPLRIDRLFRPDASGALSGARLVVDGTDGEGRLRLMSLEHREQARRLQVRKRKDFVRKHSRTYALTGSLTILQRERSTWGGRICRALAAWWFNRGRRDLGSGGSSSGLGTALGGAAFASHAGEVRTFEYELQIGDELASGERCAVAPLAPGALRGRKRITYARPSNPWRQLQEMTLTAFPGLRPGGSAVLALDPRYLAERAQPLFGIVSQRDHSEALMDIASLGGYFLRMLVSIHFWSARKPDPPPDRRVERLPGAVPGLPDPELHWVEVDQVDGEPVYLRLARYRAATGTDARRPPVVLIHGYSASGTTYAHPSLKPGLAQYLAQQGRRDAWVVDLRSSSGMPTATWPWTMERVALMDIPLAIARVCELTGAEQVDVVAHCMGAVMLSMAILSSDRSAMEFWTPADQGLGDCLRQQRAALRQRIRAVVLSQNGPAMVMTDPNIFRTYALSFVEDVLRPHTYRFRPEPGQGAAWDLLDRLFATLPYDDAELLLENNAKLSERLDHLGSRHRMDALYGRTFSLANLSPEVLRDLDDFFGPLSLDTLGQALHFSRLRTIANRNGRNRFVNHRKLCDLWTFRTMVLHGRDNGMADVATLYRIETLLEEARKKIVRLEVEGFGHQDCLIGKDAPARIFPGILGFLDAP